jgi:hypothetical protein
MNNFVRLAGIALAIAFLNLYALTTTSLCQNRNEDLLRLRIKNLHVQGTNIHLILAKVSDQNKIPIGLEVSLADDLASSENISVDVRDGTLEDVLNSVVNQYPIYSWEIRDDVINVFPREGHRDPVLKEVLDTKLEKISISKETVRFNLRETLCKSDAVMKILNLNNVTPSNETFSSRDFIRLGRDFSFEASNISLTTILNYIIRESQTKYWTIMRYGDRKQYLVLNL